jgi:hypothetical protein
MFLKIFNNFTGKVDLSMNLRLRNSVTGLEFDSLTYNLSQFMFYLNSKFTIFAALVILSTGVWSKRGVPIISI